MRMVACRNNEMKKEHIIENLLFTKCDLNNLNMKRMSNISSVIRLWDDMVANKHPIKNVSIDNTSFMVCVSFGVKIKQHNSSSQNLCHFFNVWLRFAHLAGCVSFCSFFQWDCLYVVCLCVSAGRSVESYPCTCYVNCMGKIFRCGFCYLE